VETLGRGWKPSIENGQLEKLLESNPQTTARELSDNLDNFYPFKGHRKGEKTE